MFFESWQQIVLLNDEVQNFYGFVFMTPVKTSFPHEALPKVAAKIIYVIMGIYNKICFT